MFEISQEVVTVVGVDNLTSLTIGCGLLSAAVVTDDFGVATVIIDGDDFSTTELTAVVVSFDESVTIDVPPKMVTPL